MVAARQTRAAECRGGLAAVRYALQHGFEEPVGRIAGAIGFELGGQCKHLVEEDGVVVPSCESRHTELGCLGRIGCEGCPRAPEECVELFRLAKEVAASGFGARQTLYERFFFGPPEIMASAYFNLYDKEEAKSRVETVLRAKT